MRFLKRYIYKLFTEKKVKEKTIYLHPPIPSLYEYEYLNIAKLSGHPAIDYTRYEGILTDNS